LGRRTGSIPSLPRLPKALSPDLTLRSVGIAIFRHFVKSLAAGYSPAFMVPEASSTTRKFCTLWRYSPDLSRELRSTELQASSGALTSCAAQLTKNNNIL